jgi:thiosulfate dehydrogenase (quinone) large subunit
MASDKISKLTNPLFEDLETPLILKIFFSSYLAIPVWTTVRIYIGWIWLNSSFEKLQSSAWVGQDAGTAISGFLGSSLTKSIGENPSVPHWYGNLIENYFLPNATLLSYIIAFGEFFVGLALIIGFLVGASAFFGALMNTNFMLAGAVSINPIMFVFSILLICAWRVAGFWGLDRWILPKLLQTKSYSSNIKPHRDV